MPALIPVDNTLGALFLGATFSSILYGVTWLQVYSYFSKHCANDRPFLKFFVTLLLILDSLQLALMIHAFYIAGITNFGDYLSDMRAPWSLKVQSIIGIVLTCSVQLFYARRIYHLSMGRVHVPAFIVVLSLAELGLGILYVVQCFQFPLYNQAGVQIPNITAGLSLQVACDLTITVSMVYYLLTRHPTVVKRANLAITTVLAVYCINSGALTLFVPLVFDIFHFTGLIFLSIFAITCLATFVRFPHTLIYAPAFFVLVRLYSCAFMAVLNSRDSLRTSLDAQFQKGTLIAFSHGTSTLSHVGDSDVTGANASSAPNTPADVAGPHFATQSTISGTSRTKASALRFESEWHSVGAPDGAKAEQDRTSYEA